MPGAVLGDVLRLEHDRAGTVAEQDAGAAILPVEHAAEGLCADHQRLRAHAGAQQRIGGRERVEEARAHRRDIEGDPAGLASEQRLDLRGGGGKGVVGRGGGEHDQVDLGRLDARRLERLRAASVASVEVVSPSPAM